MKPSYELHHGDCLSIMREIPSGSVDALVTDPPYGQSNESYDNGVSQEVWDECFRVLKSDAALVTFAGSPTYHRIACEVEDAGFRVRQMWGWVYRNGFITSAYPKEGFDRLAPAFDPICYATKGKVLLKLQREGKAWSDERDPKRAMDWSSRNRDHGSVKRANGHYPRSIASDGTEPFEYFVLSHGSVRGESTGHPNQKPLPLMQWIVSKLPGGTILDPFCGSGSTGVAALREGFDFIGIEQDESYCNIARRRLEAEASDLRLEVS